MSGKRAPATPPEIEGFEYRKLIGSGGFSDVFLYEQQRPRRQVAVKVLLKEWSSETQRAAFGAEADLMAILGNHPSIVTIYEAGVANDGRPYLAMEYCSRPNLGRRYRSERFSVAEALRTTVQIAGAVETAHRLGILHRDLKPANILVTQFGHPVLTDFGISSTVEDATAAEGMSIPWSPPESFGDPPTAGIATDVWALAATCYTLLAGRTPFEVPGGSNTASDLVARIEQASLPPIGRNDVPPSLERVLRIAMAKHPPSRYPTVLAFARELQQVQVDLERDMTTIDLLDEYGEVHKDFDEEDGTRLKNVTAIDPGTPAKAIDRPARPTSTDLDGETVSRARPESKSGDDPEPLSATRILSDHPARVDRIGHARDVDRIAKIVASRTTSPPLAVAIVGDWGSGKSSFMDQLQTRVDQLSKMSLAQDGDSIYVKRPCQVSFNAWHYSDNHAILGMVDEVFRAIGSHDSESQSVAAGAEIDAEQIASKLDALEARDRELRGLLEKVSRDPLDGELRVSSAQSALTSARFLSSNFLRRFHGAATGLSRVLLVATVAAVAALGAIYTLLPEVWDSWIGLATVLLSGAGVTSFALEAGHRLHNVYRAVRHQNQRFSDWSETARSTIESELSMLESERKRLQLDLGKHDAFQALTNLLSSRAGDERLDSHRGVVSVVHEHLRRLLEHVGSVDTDKGSINRIVLFVDDLDRCSPSKVVEVLHAINLLQAVPMFVVVAGVDARWLRRSLRQHDRALYTLADDDQESRGWSADPLEHLDKIFQIVFSLRSIRGRMGADYFYSLIEDTPELRLRLGRSSDGSEMRGRRIFRTPPRGRVALDDAEIELLAWVSGTLSTPRSIKKLLNVYQLIRADVSGDEEYIESGAYRAAALLLASLIEAPSQSVEMLSKVDTRRDAADSVVLIAQIASEHIGIDGHARCESCVAWERIDDMFQEAAENGWVVEPAILRRWSREIVRYSFHTVLLWERLPPKQNGPWEETVVGPR